MPYLCGFWRFANAYTRIIMGGFGYMGSYINIGVASNNSNIKKLVINLFKELKEFAFLSVHLPYNNNYDNWVSFNNKECSIEEAFEYCLKYELSYLIGEFKFNERKMNNIEFTVEKNEYDIACLIIKIPDEEIVYNIDEFEQCIIEFLTKIKGFSFAFCDCEAHLDDDKYSIYVQYSDIPIVKYEKWKIDGFTER